MVDHRSLLGLLVYFVSRTIGFRFFRCRHDTTDARLSRCSIILCCRLGSSTCSILLQWGFCCCGWTASSGRNRFVKNQTHQSGQRHVILFQILFFAQSSGCKHRQGGFERIPKLGATNRGWTLQLGNFRAKQYNSQQDKELVQVLGLGIATSFLHNLQERKKNWKNKSKFNMLDRLQLMQTYYRIHLLEAHNSIDRYKTHPQTHTDRSIALQPFLSHTHTKKNLKVKSWKILFFSL